jgi:hypothetical protein
MCDVYVTVKDTKITGFWLVFDDGFDSEYSCYFTIPPNTSIRGLDEGVFSDINWLSFNEDGSVEFGWTYVSAKNGDQRLHDFATLLFSLAHMGLKPELPITKPNQQSKFNRFLAKEMDFLGSLRSSFDIDITRLF